MKSETTKKKKKHERKIYIFRLADNGRDSFCGLRKDGIGVDTIQIHVCRDVKTGHLDLDLDLDLDRDLFVLTYN